MASKFLGLLLLVAISSSAQACGAIQTPCISCISKPDPSTRPGLTRVSYNEFYLASGGSRAQYDNFNKYAYTVGLVSSKEEAAMALAQILHESVRLTARRDWRCSEQSPCRYYSTCDVPGQYYYGRGYLQLKWCYNYRDASTAIFGNSSVLLNDPDKVAREEDLAWRTAFWFWGAKIHNKPGVQNGQFGATTKVLAPQECAAGNADRFQRERYYASVRRAFDLSGPMNVSGCN